jgi:hypothetical protein
MLVEPVLDEVDVTPISIVPLAIIAAAVGVQQGDSGMFPFVWEMIDVTAKWTLDDMWKEIPYHLNDAIVEVFFCRVEEGFFISPALVLFHVVADEHLDALTGKQIAFHGSLEERVGSLRSLMKISQNTNKVNQNVLLALTRDPH